MASEREQFVQAWEQEHGITARVIGALPEAKLEFKPWEKAMSARELAWHQVGAERFFVEGCLAGKLAPGAAPPAPATLKEIQATFDRQHKELVGKFKTADDRQLGKMIQIPVGPKQMGDMPVMGVLWMGVILHGAHHRGQLSVYLRMMGGKVPSIYGPTADERWW